VFQFIREAAGEVVEVAKDVRPIKVNSWRLPVRTEKAIESFNRT
jgi:hypothetical protein